MEKRTRSQSDLVKVLEEQLAAANKRAERAELLRKEEVASAQLFAKEIVEDAEERHKTALAEANARAEAAERQRVIEVAEANARAEEANKRVERIGTVGMQCFSNMNTKNTSRIESVKQAIVSHRDHIERGQQLTYVNTPQAVSANSPTISFQLIKGTRKEIDSKIRSSQTGPKLLVKCGRMIETDSPIKPAFDKKLDEWMRSKRHAGEEDNKSVVENVQVHQDSWTCSDNENGLVSIRDMYVFMKTTANELADEANSSVDTLARALEYVHVGEICAKTSFDHARRYSK